MSVEPFIAGGFSVLILGIQQWAMHRENLKRGEVRDVKLDFVLTEHSPHSHSEDPATPQPLMSTNIRYPKVPLNGKT